MSMNLEFSDKGERPCMFGWPIEQWAGYQKKYSEKPSMPRLKLQYAGIPKRAEFCW